MSLNVVVIIYILAYYLNLLINCQLRDIIANMGKNTQAVSGENFHYGTPTNETLASC